MPTSYDFGGRIDPTQYTFVYLSLYTHAIATNLVFSLIFWWVREFIPPTPVCVTLTDDLEIQGQVILQATSPISATTHAVETNLVLFLMFYGSGNSFQLLPNE